MSDAKNGSWGLEKHDLMERWPLDETGEKEQALFLTDLQDSGAMADMTIAQLAAYGIPAFKKYAEDGSLGHVILGFSGYGASIYVPKSLLEDAQNLLKSAELTDADFDEATGEAPKK